MIYSQPINFLSKLELAKRAVPFVGACMCECVLVVAMLDPFMPNITSIISKCQSIFISKELYVSDCLLFLKTCHTKHTLIDRRQHSFNILDLVQYNLILIVTNCQRIKEIK